MLTIAARIHVHMYGNNSVYRLQPRWAEEKEGKGEEAEKERDDGWTAAEWHDLPRRPAERGRPTGRTTWFCMCTPPQQASAFEEALEARCAVGISPWGAYGFSMRRIGHRATYLCPTSLDFYLLHGYVSSAAREHAHTHTHNHTLTHSLSLLLAQ